MAGPCLKFRNEVKLHISKGPSIKSWTIFAGLVSVGLLAAVYETDSLLEKCMYLLCCLAIGLAFMDEWEDCVMDRYQNQATLTHCNWYDRLCCRVPESHTRVLPLSSITAVQAAQSRQLFLLLCSGNSVPIMSSEASPKDLSTLVSHISSFLRLDRVETVTDRCEESSSEEEEWGDAGAEYSGSESVATSSSVPNFRIRDVIKVLAEPTPPSLAPFPLQ